MKFALVDLPRNDNLVLQGIGTDVEAEFCLSSCLVGPVASIALACQQRSNFTVEINRLRMNRERVGREEWKGEFSFGNGESILKP